MAEVPVDTLVDARYRVLSRLGSGGMADVYCAEDTHLGRQVALKVLYRRFAQDDEFVERFKREAQSAAGLTHPNVVNVYDRGEHDGTYYIAMEYLPGRTLKEVVAETGPLEQEAVIDIGVQILRAASFAHRRGVIHRDLKPHNVMLDDGGNAKVTDFGIARAGASEMTEAGSIMGTAQYLSPEQAQGHPATAQSDLYSVGIILYELLTGRLPFDGESAVSIAVQHLNDAPTPIHALRPDVAPELEAAVMRALEKDPASRWSDADEFIRALEGARGGLARQPLGQDTAAFVPVPPVAMEGPPAAVYEEVAEDPHDPWPRWPWLALAAIGLIALLLVLLLGKDQREVPTVTGQLVANATSQLEDAGFKVDVKYRPDPAHADQVIAQDPNGGTKADEGSTVKLIVSAGPGDVTVPTVEGFTEKRANQEITRAGCGTRKNTSLCGLKFEVKSANSDDVEEGLVIRTSPPGGTRVEVGTRVLVFVSKGPKQVEVPDVVNLARESAESTLNRAGLGFTIHEQESDREPGTVLAQDPGGGTIVDKGSRVTLTIAKEPEMVEVPDVVGFSRDSAMDAIRGVGLKPVVVEEEVQDVSEIDQVLRESPRPGAEVEPKTEVEITVGKAPDESQQGDEVPPEGTEVPLE